MKRRLIGPTVITLILTGLVADYMFLSDSPWSVVNVLAKIALVFGAIFTPALDPKNLAWLDAYLLPLTVIMLAFALLWLVVTRANQAMLEVTQDAELSVPSAAQSQLSDIRRAVEWVTEAEPATAQPRQYPLVHKLS